MKKMYACWASFYFLVFSGCCRFILTSLKSDKNELKPFIYLIPSTKIRGGGLRISTTVGIWCYGVVQQTAIQLRMNTWNISFFVVLKKSTDPPKVPWLKKWVVMKIWMPKCDHMDVNTFKQSTNYSILLQFISKLRHKSLQKNNHNSKMSSCF